ncbi:chaperone protein ClpB1 [Rosa chinensis]|nr:chaperone protein ClpB1 [Rosa chinensis]
MEPPSSTLQLMGELREDKEELEITYGVQIPEDALSLACSIAMRYSDVLLAATKDVNYKTEKSLPGQLAVHLLAKACFELINDFDMGVENCFDVYSLIRAHIELNECKKEKAPTSQCWIDYVTDEYKDLKEKWHTLEGKWKLVLQSRRRSERRTQEVEALKHVRVNLLSYLQQPEVVKPTDLMQLFSLVHVLGKDQNELLTIYPFMIAKVAWSLTGIPKSWLLHSTEPLFLPDIGPTFAKRVVGQELPKLAVTGALTELGPGAHPIASFLFLCRPGCGRTELAKAIAELFFDEKDRLTELNMVKYKCADHVSDEDEYDFPRYEPKSEFREHLLEAVKKSPFGVVLLDNIEVARPSDVDILVEILTHGRLSDGKGHYVDFTKIVIILTSNVVQDPFMLRCCKCTVMVENCFFKDLDEDSPNGVCRHLLILRKARKHFRTDLFETLNDVIAFEPLSLLHYRCVTRLLLRDIACSITEKRLIICPSEAAVRAILLDSDFTRDGTKSIKSYLQTNVEAMLKDRLNEIDGPCVFYMDASVGTEELSYFRFEKMSALDYDQELRDFVNSSSELRSTYKKEKVWLQKVSMLKRSFPEFLANQKAVKDPAKVSKVLHIIDSLLENATHENATVNAFGSLEKSVEPRDDQLGRSKKMAKNGINGLRASLSNLMVKDEFIGTVAAALLMSIDSPPQGLPCRPAKTFLLLGLTEVGKADLVKGLMEHFVSDDGMSLLFQIDMSKHDDTETCFSSMYTSNGQAVKIVPFGIFLIDRVEDALPSEFNALIQLLDCCTMSDEHGRKVIFSCCIVMVASSAGNKDFIEKLVLRKYSARFNGNVLGQELKTFRFELLNRMDEMVLFSSLFGDQLGKFLRLSMDGGGDLHENPVKEALAFELAFQDLFLPAKSLSDPPSPQNQADSMFYLLKWRVIRDGLEVMDKSTFYRHFLNGSSGNMNESDTGPVFQLSL